MVGMCNGGVVVGLVMLDDYMVGIIICFFFFNLNNFLYFCFCFCMILIKDIWGGVGEMILWL